MAPPKSKYGCTTKSRIPSWLLCLRTQGLARGPGKNHAKSLIEQVLVQLGDKSAPSRKNRQIRIETLWRKPYDEATITTLGGKTGIRKVHFRPCQHNVITLLGGARSRLSRSLASGGSPGNNRFDRQCDGILGRISICASSVHAQVQAPSLHSPKMPFLVEESCTRCELTAGSLRVYSSYWAGADIARHVQSSLIRNIRTSHGHAPRGKSWRNR